MTCIVGIEDPDTGSVYIGGDLCVSSTHLKATSWFPKVFYNGEFLIGTAGDLRFNQIMQHRFEPPEYRPDRQDLYEYMCVDFVDALRECMVESGYGRESGVADCGEDGGVALIGYGHTLWTVYSDFTVFRSDNNYATVGSGEHVALGALYVLRVLNGVSGLHVKEQVEMAIHAAGTHVLTVDRQVCVLSLPQHQE